MLMFLYICQALPHFQFTGKVNNWNWEKVYLVVCCRLLVVCGVLLMVCWRLLVVRGSLLVFCGRLLVVWDHLCLFVVVCGHCLF